MKISDILANRILPFEIEDEKLKKLFSFYLHSAPTIESKSAAMIEAEKLAENWLEYRSTFPQDMSVFYAASYPPDKFQECLLKYKLNNEADVNRRIKAFVCKKKDKDEQECQCLLRHLRNSIAHDNVYLSNAGNRKYILFEDFNKSDNLTARILLSQADLSTMKRIILK